jgi:hypothetical protein
MCDVTGHIKVHYGCRRRFYDGCHLADAIMRRRHGHVRQICDILTCRNLTGLYEREIGEALEIEKKILDFNDTVGHPSLKFEVTLFSDGGVAVAVSQ